MTSLSCPTPFPYKLARVRPNIVRLDIDRDLADLAGVKAREYFIGPSAWDCAARAAQKARDAFYASWADAHGEIA